MVPVRTVRVQVRFQTVPVCAVPVRALCVGCGRFVRFGSLAVRFVRPGSIRIYHDIEREGERDTPLPPHTHTQVSTQ